MANKKRSPSARRSASGGNSSADRRSDAARQAKDAGRRGFGNDAADGQAATDNWGPATNSTVRLGWKRWLISAAIIAHLMAIVLPPLMFQSGGSPIVATLLDPLRPYTEFLYLDRGYAFFAPDPGPSHLIEAAITQSDGTRTEVKYPDRQEQWPRLLYHRHFMLSEFLTEVYQPPGPPPGLAEIDRPASEEWARLRLRYEHVRQSIIDHLRHANGDKPVAIRRIEHLIPSAEEFVGGDFALNEPLLYDVMRDLPIVVAPPANAAQPMALPESIPAPSETEDLAAPKTSEEDGEEANDKADDGGAVDQPVKVEAGS